MPNQPAVPQAVPDVGAVADNLRLSVTMIIVAEPFALDRIVRPR